MNQSFGLYIHIPFCIKKCLYCDFCSFESTGKEQENYVNALIEEMNLVSKEYGRLLVSTIFIGGGTPTAINSMLIKSIVNSAKKLFDIDDSAEITIESNPGTITLKKLEDYKECGINRISIGLQAVQNNLLKTLGRTHSFETFLDSYQLIRKVGFNNVNVDLMYGLPNQTEENWQETIMEVVSLNPEHISAYSLKVEEGTAFEKLEEKGLIQIPEEEIDRRNHHEAIKFFSNHGYKQYEISNFAKSGYECKHNLIYWENKNYIGLGLGAHGYINRKRYGNLTDMKKYIISLSNKKLPIESTEEITLKDEIFESIMLGLRLNKGLSLVEFKDRFGVELEALIDGLFKELLSEELLFLDSGNLKFTSYGMDISNSVLVRILDTLEKNKQVY